MTMLVRVSNTNNIKTPNEIGYSPMYIQLNSFCTLDNTYCNVYYRQIIILRSSYTYYSYSVFIANNLFKRTNERKCLEYAKWCLSFLR